MLSKRITQKLLPETDAVQVNDCQQKIWWFCSVSLLKNQKICIKHKKYDAW